MTFSIPQMGQDSAYERFLGATVGEDISGAEVSVLSMLARLGLDPWSEASDLDKMPNDHARKRLEALLSRFKDVPTLGSDRGKMVSALLEVLPRKKVSAKRTGQWEPMKRPELVIGAPIYWIIAAVLLLGWFINLAQGQ